LVFPLTRKLIIQSFSKNFKSKKDENKGKDFIEGEYKDMDDK